jgi:hypothetical protein
MTGKNTNKKQLSLSPVLILILIIAAYSIADKMTLSTSIEGDWAGICVHSLSEDEAQLVSESGAGWVRIDASGSFGAAAKNAKAHNLKVLGILDSWMFNQSTTFTLEEWRNAVAHYVSNYSDSVDAWEIWNEPANPKQNWTLLNLDLNVSSPENMSNIVQFYFSMAQIASPIIHQYDPTAKTLLFGGLTLWSGNAPNLALDKEFAQQLAALNIEQYGDAISLHAYPCMEKVEPWIWEKYNQSHAYYRGLFNMEVWVTETGHAAGSEGENGQAQYMSDALQYFNGKVAKLFWYSLLDNTGEERFGLIENGTTPRLAYYELQKQLTDK